MDCIKSGCTNLAAVRGLCSKHYQDLRSKLRHGEMSEKAAVEDGLILARGKQALLRKAPDTGFSPLDPATLLTHLTFHLNRAAALEKELDDLKQKIRDLT